MKHHCHPLCGTIRLGVWTSLAALLAGLGGGFTHPLRAAERPLVTQPRATSGDTAVEPDWAERLAITVGPEKADLNGTSDRVLQAAVDYVARLGGGTVRILPGTYRLRNSVFLASRVRLVGAGAGTVLIKADSMASPLAADSDWYDQEITLASAAGFEVGDGVCLRAKNPHSNGQTVIKRTLVARQGGRFKLDRPLRENLWQMGEASAATLFPILSGEGVADVEIENLVLDGNKERNANLDGNYAGCIWLQDCSRVVIRGVTARNYNGDGLSWQVCHEVVVEHCVSAGHTGLGFHPGSGSQRTVIRHCRAENNDIGLFFCWGVKYGLAEQNQLVGNRVGISIGHRDTGNLVAGNQVVNSRETGILFRPERDASFAGNHNLILSNRVENSGGENGVAIDVQGPTQDVVLRQNELIETRQPGRRVAIRLGRDTRNIRLETNVIKGFAQELQREPAR